MLWSLLLMVLQVHYGEEYTMMVQGSRRLMEKEQERWDLFCNVGRNSMCF